MHNFSTNIPLFFICDYPVSFCEIRVPLFLNVIKMSGKY